MIALVDKLERQGWLSDEEMLRLLSNRTPELARELTGRAVRVRNQYYGNRVFLRGLIEFTNYCRNNCYYCGLRCSNGNISRYRLSSEQILHCCQVGYDMGLRTFVLQGGEDPLFSPERVEALVLDIKKRFPDCAVTLSVGEYSRDVYEMWFAAGADRYLLRHETADSQHYAVLHPENLRLESRMRCLRDLKEIGYQVGCGFMVGSPGQTLEHIVKDLQFLREFQPHMVGIGPFIPQKDTPFGGMPAGDWELTVYLLSVIRLMLPEVLLPSTTALGTIHPQGRELGILAGANVCMPNLSPRAVRKDYALYDNKICTGAEAVETLQSLRSNLEGIGCQVDMSRGDYWNWRI